MSSSRNFLVNQMVRVKGLNNTQYNGKFGVIVPFPSAELTNNGRYRVKLIAEVAPPLLSELSVKPENLDHVCVRCYKEGEKLMTCAKCRQATYCNRECQRMDWERHKTVCRHAGHSRDASRNPLYLAVEHGNLLLVQKLVEEGIKNSIATPAATAAPPRVRAPPNNRFIIKCDKLSRFVYRNNDKNRHC